MSGKDSSDLLQNPVLGTWLYIHINIELCQFVPSKQAYTLCTSFKFQCKEYGCKPSAKSRVTYIVANANRLLKLDETQVLLELRNDHIK